MCGVPALLEGSAAIYPLQGVISSRPAAGKVADGSMLYRFTVSRGAPGVLVVLVVLTGLAAVLTGEAAARAAVVVSVRARTRIEIAKVAPSGNGIRVSGPV